MINKRLRVLVFVFESLKTLKKSKETKKSLENIFTGYFPIKIRESKNKNGPKQFTSVIIMLNK
ncbi:hypothetical protein EMIT091MI3_120171 [Kosakonia quasisacchari]